MSSDLTDQPTPAELTPEQRDAEQNEACGLYAKALITDLVTNHGGNVDLMSDHIQLRIGQVHFQALLNEIARQTGFDMGALHREFVTRLKSEAERIAGSGVKIHVASAVRGRKQ
jgi:hypothetical protein